METEKEEEDVCTLQLTFQLLPLPNYPLKAESSPFLIASFCQLNHSPEQLFIVIVEQVEVMDESEAEEEGEKLQVFFSFCNQKYPHKCVGKRTFVSSSQNNFNFIFVFVAFFSCAQNCIFWNLLSDEALHWRSQSAVLLGRR